ncbi:MAG: TonB-dependent receptor plug domain-containing protein [Bacteroidales bacterium]|nr:TonB-dependent receptor plug domain-containing protein [Bacteroidales bacterium]
MYFIKYFFFCLLLLLGVEALAQEADSIIILNQVEVKSFRILEKQSQIRSTQKIEKVELIRYSTSTLTDLLSKNTNITINQYGVSGISSVSMRGGNANHTAVLWNGFNLQDPLNGAFNLALSTVNIIDDIGIDYGGNSALYGSGAVGGTIRLNNLPNYEGGVGIGIQQSIGSFGKHASLVNVSYGRKKLFLRTKFFYSAAKNDFEYVNFAKLNHPIDTLKNAQVKLYGVLQELYYIINDKNEISTQFWVQKSDNQIAPNMTVSDGFSTQKDEFIRWATTYKRKSEKIDLEIRNGLFSSKQNFIKSDIGLNVNHLTLNNITEAIGSYKLNDKNTLLLGVNNNYNEAESDNYNTKETLNKTAYFLSYKFDVPNKIFLNANIRTEMINGSFNPFTYGIKAEVFIVEDLSVNTNISKNYRSPNFNDLYWVGAYAHGNPHLKDEDGYSVDLGLNHQIHTKRLTTETNMTVYYSKFTNLIYWQAEGDFWMPQNKKLVLTKGVEFRLNTAYKFTNAISGFLNVNYTYTDASLKEKADNESDDVLDKQLVYIPYYQANGLIGMQYKKLRFDMIIKYVGQRYTTADNKNWLDKYILTDLNLTYTVNHKSINATIFAKVNNIFSTQYMVREWYPTPLVNYEIGIKIMYN